MKLRSVAILLVLFGTIFLQRARAQAEVRETIRQLAQKQIRVQCPDCSSEVTISWLPQALSQVPGRAISRLRFEEVGLPAGYQVASVRYEQSGQVRARQVQLHIRLQRNIPVANKRLQRNQRIAADDITWKRKDLSRMRARPVTSPEQIVGQTVGRMIQKGGVIWPSDLKKMPIVEAGDEVKIIYHTGGVQVALDGTARQARARGESIRVYSVKTRKVYIGKVLTSEKVIWQETL